MNEYEWYVVMYRREGDVEEHRLGPFSTEQVAERADEVLNVRIDRERFYTRVLKKHRKGSLLPVRP